MFFLFLFSNNIICAEDSIRNNREFPGLPFNPIPTNLETGIDIDIELSWENGENTDFVDVYFSSNESLVDLKDPSVKVITEELINHYTPGTLEYNIQYYWRIVSKNTEGFETDGSVWSFTTLFRIDQFPFSESFEIQFPPENWTISDINNNDGDWIWNNNTNQPAGGGVANGEHLVYFNSYSSSIDSSTRLETPSFDFSERQDMYISFQMFHDLGEPNSDDVLIIQIFNTLERTWSYLETIHRNDGSEGWKRHLVELDNYTGESNVQIGFLGVSQSGNDIHIDNVFIDEHIQLASDPIPTQLNSGEYYFDTDPGYGNGTEFSFTSGDNINIDFDIPLSSLSPGSHILFVRIRNESGMWTETANYIFARPMDVFIETYPDSIAPILVSGEYFVDIDPGFNEAEEFTFTPSDSINVELDFSKLGYNAGQHILGYRIRNESGFWSETALTNFVIMDTIFVEVQPDPIAPQLILGEYFVDIDPGFTNGIEFTFNQADSVEINLELLKEGYSAGRHIIGYRIKNESGFWSETALTSFEVMDTLFIEVQPDPIAPQLILGEYFVDNDPGFTNGIEFTFNQADSVQINLELLKEEYSAGRHIIGYRIKNESGFWSETALTSFEVMDTLFIVVQSDPQASQLNSGEYFFDVDPGFGNGVPFYYPSADSLNYSFDYSKESFEPGSHFLGVRMKNEDGFWSESAIFSFSMLRADYVVVEPDPVPELITYLSFYFHDENGSYGPIEYNDFTPSDEINLMLSLDTSSYSLNDTSYTHVTAYRGDGTHSLQAFRLNEPISNLEAPQNLQIEYVNDQIHLSWDPVFSASSYKIYRNTNEIDPANGEWILVHQTEETSCILETTEIKSFYYIISSTENISIRGFRND